ncbi:MAG: hypothetical protein UY21_C0012G0014 [Microgenomates group bacterium GW2011_GWA1_48_10]|nr:MAG: hypothetical protein UY21_C0012G0014 [Microgenomates group bacterium GW2011_GWA1_48_10]
MEQHAVPQDITGFKFKLVGDMTLKQFGELAFGAIMAYVFLSTGWHPVIKWPLVFFFAILGVGLAFVPIQERPLDAWIINFFRAIYRPTYYIWKRNSQAGLVTPPPTAKEPVKFEEIGITGLVTSPVAASGGGGQKVEEGKKESQNVTNEEEIEQKVLDALKTDTLTPVATEEAGQPDTPSGTTAPPQGTRQSPLSIDQLLSRREQTAAPKTVEETGAPEQTQNKESDETKVMTVEELLKMRQETGILREEKNASDLTKSETKINELIEKNKQMLMEIDEIRNKMFSMAGQDTAELQKRLDEIMVEKNALAGEIAKAREEVTAARIAPVAIPSYQEPIRLPIVRTAQKPVVKPPVISLTALPNVINGLVLDSGGTPMEGVILIIRDDQGNSIRALRTNKIGQFIASTPLLNGKYYLELEKAGYDFDNWEVTLSGQVLEPLEVRAKATEQLGASS